uniref:Transposase n=1 Tax=Streptomyces sp. NBC_00003 TaxID=2903608 RepID=A0AAU2VH81_9ACTN
MAFGADELRVLRRALAIALHPTSAKDQDIQECLRLADAVDEAVREADRLRAFLLADLARYRDALPGSLPGYTELLQDALAAGYDPGPDDLAALRALRSDPVCAALLERCRQLAERSVRARLAGRVVSAPAQRTRLLTLVDGGAADKGRGKDKSAEPHPGTPARPAPEHPAPGRPVPKPSEVFPPRRRPVPPPEKRRAG